jgi:hypothetical protein
MRYERTLILACLFWAAIACMSTAYAAEIVIGSVLAVRGEVYRAAGAGQSALAAKAPVYLGDTIVSGAGKAKISLNDGTIVSIGENTRLRLSMYQSTANDLTTRLDILSGVLRAFVARVVASGRFEIESETAVAAVRGTDWLVDITSKGTAVAVISGTVAVSGRVGQNPATVLLDAPGRGTDVDSSGQPTAPHPWGAQRFATTLARATFE